MNFGRRTSRAHAKRMVGGGGGGDLNGFRFGDFRVRFPSDGAASMSVKGLMIRRR